MNATDLSDRMQSLLDAAALAPSSHNTQPWLFGIDGNRVNLYADRERALPANDPDDRELMISCGCALFNLRIAAAAAGYAVAVNLFPDAGNAALLASVDLESGGEPDEDTRRLSAEIGNRRTYRKAFRDAMIPDAVKDQLREAARLEGAWVEIVADDARDDVAQLVGDGDSSQWSDSAWRSELADWMHPRSAGDGLTMPAAVAPVARFVVRRADMGRFVGKHDSELAAGAPLLAVLGTDRDERTDWLRAGQALERLLLEASANGIQASYLNQPIQVAALRPELERRLGLDGAAQLLLRLGYPDGEVGSPPRRDVGDIVGH